MRQNRNTWIETHAHLHVKAFDKDNARAKTMKTLFGVIPLKKPEDRVKYVINVAIDFDSNRQQLEMIKKSKYKRHLYMVCGIHPNTVDINPATDRGRYDELKNKYLVHKKCVGIGETGLDYKRVRRYKKGGIIDLEYAEQMVPRQETWFRNSIELSIETGLPLVMHIRNCVDDVIEIPNERYSDAYEDAIAILSEYFKETDTEIRGICHSFNGSINQMKSLLKLGFMIGVNGMVTYPGNTYLRKCIENCPIDRIVVETDSPYLSPYTLDGERLCKNNTPVTVPVIGQWIAKIKGMAVDEVQRITTGNAKRVFRLHEIC